MNKIKGIIIFTSIVIILVVLAAYLEWSNNEINKKLEISQNNLQTSLEKYNALQDEFEYVQKSLNNKIKDYTELQETYENNIQDLEQELKNTNKVIDELKSTEYKLIYLGEFKLTAYCSCVKCCGQWAIDREVDENGNPIVLTASGATAQVNHTVAVDPSVLPFGSELYVPGYGFYVAEDSGNGVEGNHLDIYFSSHDEAVNHGLAYNDVWLIVKKNS